MYERFDQHEICMLIHVYLINPDSIPYYLTCFLDNFKVII